MAETRTVVEILNNDLEKVAEVKNLYPLNKQGMILRYSKELSDYGECVFRVKTDDPMFDEFGDILKPHQYHVRIKRGKTTVWQGAIVDNPHRTHEFQEVQAHEYLYYLDKVLVKRLSELDTGGGFHYRIFSSGTMASNITTMLTEVTAAFGTNHIMADLAAGTVTSPDFPAGFTTTAGAALTGTWTFSDSIKLQFDYHTVLYVLKAFALYGGCDFRINNDLTFDFKPFIGNKQFNLTFIYSTQGNVVDYDVPRLGRRMVNSLYGIAADNQGNILRENKIDTTSKDTNGLLEGAIAFGDVKDQNSLRVRTAEELRYVKDPNTIQPVNFVLNEKGYPIGQYDIGDIIQAKIKDGVIDYFEPRRVVRIVANVHDTGRELVTVTTNTPKDSQLGAS